MRTWVRRNVVGIVVVVWATALPGCDGPLGTGGDDAISTSLVHVLHWGRVSAVQDEPNAGEYTSGDIRQPVWYRPDCLFVRTEHLDDGAYVRGISAVTVDPVTFAFRGIDTLAFPFLLRDFDYNPVTDEFVLTFSRDPSNIQTVRARGESSALVVVDTVLGEAWLPRGARFVEPDGALVVYATDPATQVAGYYQVSNPPAPADSLIVAVELPPSEARGFDVAAGVLCMGRSDESSNTEVSVVDLNGDRVARVVRVLAGEFRSIGLDPAGSCALVATERFDQDPGARVAVLDLASGSFAEVDVQTRPGTFAIADFASWNPAGGAFAFSASGFTGEQAVFPRELWVRRSVACR